MAVLERYTQIGLIVGLALAAAKLAAGVLGNSSALIADAAESAADSVGSIIVWRALRVAARPPDERHPYGYGRAEAVAGLLVGSGLIVAAGLIVVRAVHQLLTPHPPPKAWTLVVLAVVVVAKELLARLLARAAQRHDSEAARAEATHHRADAITSAAAALGVTLAVWGPGWFSNPKLVYADEVAALIAAAIVVFTARTLIRRALSELLDAAPPELLRQITAEAGRVPGVLDVEKVLARKSGAVYFVDMHVHVDPSMSVADAHNLSGRVKHAVRTALPSVAQVLIHIEPASERFPATS